VLVSHLRKKDLVREALLQTIWENYLTKQPNITLQILHAYVTGVLTHIVLIAPWHLVITHANFSIFALPVTFALSVFTQYQFFKVLNVWFYRDHWLGHNSELEFLYLHGPHHDAVPCGLIGVGGDWPPGRISALHILLSHHVFQPDHSFPRAHIRRQD
jgi:hypothetical protein